MKYIVHTYLFGIVFLCAGFLSLRNTIKNPIPDNRSSPLQGNVRGFVFGIGSILMGASVIIAKLFFAW